MPRSPLPAPVVDAWVQTEKEEVTAHLRTVLQPDPGVLEPLTALAELTEGAVQRGEGTPGNLRILN